MNPSCLVLETKALRAERTISSSTNISVALKAAIDSAELYMQALRLADKSADRSRLDAKCKQMLIKAERLRHSKDRTVSVSKRHHPASVRPLNTKEKIILLEGSKLNGFMFRPWEDAPLGTDFDAKDGDLLFTDSPPLSLSEAQLEHFGGWLRPKDALALLDVDANAGEPLSKEPCMSWEGKVDLVQDLTSDCSVVASLCSATARTERGHAKLSSNGKYIYKLYFNGCWRRVEIDDRLPTSTNSRILHVVDRAHPGLLWPALLEKAYLKVRGGYDFPGSNSGTDLAVISGWIPQQVFLHDPDIEPDSLWLDTYSAFNKGDINLTIGTGKLSKREQKQLGLAAEHDYAVLEMKDNEGVREMLIKNPWADGDVWRGAARRKPNPSHDEEDEQYPALPPATDSDAMQPGTFWMDFDSVFQHFENLYVNWDPALFRYRYDQHFSWSLVQRRPVSSIFDEHVQFSIRASENEEIWVLLNRHFRTGDYTHENSGTNGYISLYLYESAGFRVLVSTGAQTRGPFVDSPNTLLRFQAVAGLAYTVAIVQQDLPVGKHNFTLSAFSTAELVVQEAASRLPKQQSLGAAWTRATAGGNSDSSSYLTNPQFTFKLGSSQAVAIVMKVLQADGMPAVATQIHVKLAIVASDGKRVIRMRAKDIKAHSGDYHRADTVIEKILPHGNYTVICSTFEQGELAKFSLDFYCESASSISALPSEGSGRMKVTPSPVVFEPGCNKCLAPIDVLRMNRVTFIARQASRSAGTSMFRLGIERGQGPYKMMIADSSMDDHQYLPVATGLRIDDLTLEPSMCSKGLGGLWLVIERLAQGSPAMAAAELLEIDILAESNLQIGPWGVGDG